MKNVINLIFLLICSQGLYSQTLLTEKLENKQLNNFIGSIDSYTNYPVKLGSLSAIISYNEAGSSNIPETDEASQNLIITVCADGPPLDCFSYVYKDKINIRVHKVTEDDKQYHILIEYGIFNKRKIEDLIINKI